MNKIKIYLASGWFTKNQEEVLSKLEDILRANKNIDHFFPRHDGVKLTPNEFHDHELRKLVFNANVNNITSSNYLLVNFDGRDGFYDTGTVWEAGYAVSHGIPIIVFDTTGTFHQRFTCLLPKVHAVFSTYEDLIMYLNIISMQGSSVPPTPKVMFVGPDTTEQQVNMNADIVSLLVENTGMDIRWLDQLSHNNLYQSDDIFAGVEYVVAVIDDRHPMVSWIMGQAYERGIPIVTYTNHDYTVNLMLLFSIVAHCQGKDALKAVVQQIKRHGIDSLSELDTTAMRVE